MLYYLRVELLRTSSLGRRFQHGRQFWRCKVARRAVRVTKVLSPATSGALAPHKHCTTWNPGHRGVQSVPSSNARKKGPPRSKLEPAQRRTQHAGTNAFGNTPITTAIPSQRAPATVTLLECSRMLLRRSTPCVRTGNENDRPFRGNYWVPPPPFRISISRTAEPESRSEMTDANFEVEEDRTRADHHPGS